MRSNGYGGSTHILKHLCCYAYTHESITTIVREHPSTLHVVQLNVEHTTGKPKDDECERRSTKS